MPFNRKKRFIRDSPDLMLTHNNYLPFAPVIISHRAPRDVRRQRTATVSEWRLRSRHVPRAPHVSRMCSPCPHHRPEIQSHGRRGLDRENERAHRGASFGAGTCCAFPKSRLPVYPYKADTFFYWYQCLEAIANGDEDRLQSCLLELETPEDTMSVAARASEATKDKFWQEKLSEIAASRVLDNCMSAVMMGDVDEIEAWCVTPSFPISVQTTVFGNRASNKALAS